MRLGYTISMAAEDDARIGLHRLPELVRAGYDYAEVPLAQVMALDDAAFAHDVLGALDDAGIPCEANNNFLPRSIRLTGPHPDRDVALDYARRAFARARAMGSRIVVFGSSGSRNAPSGFPLETATAQYFEWLREFGSLADDHGLLLVVEHLNRLESNVVTTFREGMEAVKDLRARGAGMLLDTYHFHIGNEDPALIVRHASAIGHVHLARTCGRSLPCDGDEGDVAISVAALAAGGYDGRISIESYLDDPVLGLGRAASLVRRLWAGRPAPAPLS
ncbi:MAG: sugar phosphate isomerase/epimerase [Clostridia bacterium]|nr:sugar phosphate isomerase/epimerase [Clostridia bacterium]